MLNEFIWVVGLIVLLFATAAVVPLMALVLLELIRWIVDRLIRNTRIFYWMVEWFIYRKEFYAWFKDSGRPRTFKSPDEEKTDG